MAPARRPSFSRLLLALLPVCVCVCAVLRCVLFPQRANSCRFSIADLGLSFAAGMILSGDFDYIPASYLDQFPRIKDLTLKAKAHPITKAYEEHLAATKAAKAAADTQAAASE